MILTGQEVVSLPEVIEPFILMLFFTMARLFSFVIPEKLFIVDWYTKLLS